jgi:hypothetical protein
MSEDQTPPAGDAADASAATKESSSDDLRNLKAEMNRKLGNLEQTNAQLMAYLQTMNKPAPAAPAAESSKKLDDLWYSNPDEAARLIEDRAAAKAESRIAARNEAASKSQAALVAVINDFPELADNNSDFAKKAVAIYNSYSPEEQANPISYKAAAQQAAFELNMKPKSKRKQDNADDSFSIGGGSGDHATRPSKRRDADVDPNTLAFAELLGQPVNDPKYVERLKKHSQRKNWKKYE